MQISIRPATQDDAPALAHIFIAARRAMTYLPALHTDDETRRFIAHVTATSEVYVAELALGARSIPAGFAALSLKGEKNVLDHLYMRPDAQDYGAGSALLSHVKTQRPQGFRLWCFQANTGACRFYERHGLTLAQTTDGRDNEEKLPDMLYVWEPD